MSTYRVTFLHPVADPARTGKLLSTSFFDVPDYVVNAMDESGVFHIGGSPEDPTRGVRVYTANCVWVDAVPMSVFKPPVGSAAARAFNPDDVDTKVHLSLAE